MRRLLLFNLGDLASEMDAKLEIDLVEISRRRPWPRRR
jgi:hypothetical protein